MLDFREAYERGHADQIGSEFSAGDGAAIAELDSVTLRASSPSEALLIQLS